MEFNQLIRERREITQYTNDAIPDHALRNILDAALLAPSGNGLPSREFIVVREKERLHHLEGTTPFMPWLKEAAAAIVVTGRPDVSKYWLQDASIACSYIWLSAVDQGLGAAFGAVYHAHDEKESKIREDFVRKALSIPSDTRILAIIGLGYPAAHPGSKEPPENSELIYYESYQRK
ncbi:nitroreductase family protein [Alteribacillus iranensis]|uniref:Nitroreductase n=1 Tax=Alteribacillus iranensis TaxID=930128 RepID=A0A1I2B1C5_9BACI|nr:nitroreductase family protein [Alteribacillus iranensis]SFE49964.1 Nitroreductase [Alteribacillus iranensis]